MRYILQIFALISCLIVNSCYKDEDYLLNNLQDEQEFIEAHAVVDSIEADGESSVEIRAKIPLDSKDDKSTVTFITTKGEFENGEKEEQTKAYIMIDEGVNQKIASVKLTSDQVVGYNHIVAKVDNFVDSATIKFIRAFPKKISLTTSSIILKNDFNTKITLTTNLIRNLGNVSKYTHAETKVIDSSGKKRGYFMNYNNLADNSGMINNNFTLGDDSCNCSKLFAISEANSETEIIRDTIVLLIK